MACLDLECGYLAVGCPTCHIEIFNNALTAQFISAAQSSCDDEEWPGERPCCSNSLRPSQIGGQCDSWLPDVDLLHPGQELEDGSYAGWWFDPSAPILSGGVFGFIVKRHTLGTADVFEGSARDAIRRRPRLYRKGIRLGVIEGTVITNSKASAQYAMEALRNQLVNPQADCPCNTEQMSVYRFCCGPDEGQTGLRQIYDAGAFDLQPDDTLTVHNKCSGICDFTLTYEVANPALYAVDSQIDGVVTSTEECLCHTPCPDVNVYEDVEIHHYTAKKTRSIKLIYDQGEGIKIACPVDFADWSVYNPDTDLLVVTELQGLESQRAETPTSCVPYRINLFVDGAGNITWEPVMPSRWPSDGSLPCDDCDVIISSITYPNANYQPTCPDCSQFSRQCAEDVGLAFDDVTGEIDWAANGIMTGFSSMNHWTTTVPGPIQTLLDYWECINLRTSTTNLGPVAAWDLPAMAASCSVTEGDVWVEPGNFIEIRFGAIDCNAVISYGEFHGFGLPIPPEGSTSTCGAEDGEHCFPELTLVVDTAVDPQSAEYIDIRLNGSGAAGGGTVTRLAPAQWPNPAGGLPRFTQLAVEGCTPTTRPVTEVDLRDNCAPPIPEGSCVDITIVDADLANWSPVGWDVGALWPYEYDPTQFDVCDQDPAPIITTTIERRPISYAPCADGPCPSTVLRFSAAARSSCWDTLCDPLEFTAHQIEFDPTNCNIRYAGRLNLINRSGQPLEKISVEWYRQQQVDQPAPVDDWDYWRCSQIPLATQRITYLANGESIQIDNSGISLFCGGRWQDGLNRIDTTQLIFPEFLGSSKIYAVVRHNCCGDGPGDIEVRADLTAIETI